MFVYLTAVVIFFACLPFFYVWRNEPMIRLRNPLLIFLQLSLTILHGGADLLPTPPVYCFVSILIKTISRMFLFSSVLLRCFLLTYIFRLVEESALIFNPKKRKQNSNAQSSAASTAAGGDKYAKLRNARERYSNKELFLLFLKLSIPAFVYIVIMLVGADKAGTRSMHPDAEECDLQRHELAFNFLYIIGIVGTLAWISRKLKKIDENFGIISEFKGIIAVYVFFPTLALFSIVILKVENPFTTEYSKVVHFVAFFLVINSGVVTLVKAYRSILKKRKNGNSQMETTAIDMGQEGFMGARYENFEEMLNNTEYSALFMDFLKKEFATENLLLLQSTKKWRNLCGSEETRDRERRIAELAQFIHDMFIKPNALLSANISADAREEAEKKINGGDYDPDMFQEIDKEIKILLFGDTYMRFVLTPAYQSILRAHQKDTHK